MIIIESAFDFEVEVLGRGLWKCFNNNSYVIIKAESNRKIVPSIEYYRNFEIVEESNIVVTDHDELIEGLINQVKENE